MASQQWNYDVFISFRGEDTRNNFLCHLNGALSRKGLKTFVDDRLQRGEEINSALLQAIQDSKVAVIIFSKNYASSSWCLDELLKITECRETHSQIVIPVFYHVDPSDVRKQNGSFGESFKQHSENPRNDSKKIQEWKDALTKAANLSGWDSDAIRKDNELIDQIVEDISEQLEPFYRCSLQGFVGLDRKISQVKTLLATRSSDVRVLGIWGMGGIGKTTLAEAIFAQVSRQSEGRCFVKNVRESFEQRCEQRLLEQLFSELLQQSDVKIHTTNIGPDSRLVGWLKKKEVFVVFDDVSHRSQIEFLIGNPCWFRKRSIILITSRDKQVFEGITDNLYNVEALSYIESRQLFARNAFKQKHPSQDRILIDSFVNYAGGNPLAIKVLGSNVCGKGVELWKDARNKLSKCPNQDIHNVLKLSYDRLDREEKAVFLDIACFFKGEKINEAKRILSSCGLSADIGVSVLVDKSLVTISSCNRLDMHDLLQDMGREIVRQESSDLGQRSRLWNSEEIRNVLEKNKGTEAIESISLNMSQIEDIVLHPDVFKGMPNLKFLRFYTTCGDRNKVHLRRGLHFLPSELRYLYWDKYPLEFFPTDFAAKELVLHLPNSNIKHLSKDGKDGGKLKAVAQFFTNIASGILPSGIGNIKVPSSSCQFLSKITSLDMRHSENLKSFPDNVVFQCLEILNVEGCSNLEILPVISTELRKLNVGGTAIKEVHSSSIERLSKLEELCMAGCRKLQSLPTNICKLQALQKLDLYSCSSLKKFPEMFEPMYNLRRVRLSYSGIEVIPSSIDNVKGKCLNLESCLDLALVSESFGNLIRRLLDFKNNLALVFKRMPNLKFLRFYTSWGERSKLHLTGGLHFLPSGLRYLFCDECSLESLPTDFDAKEQLVLDLPRSNIKQILKAVKDAGKLKAVAQFLIESPVICRVTNNACGILPSGIGNIKAPSSSCQFFSKIVSLHVRHCQNLKSFPNNVDFQWLEILDVEGCSNLEILPVISTELRTLNVGGTAIKEVHSSSIERLSKLEWLCMGGCRKLESLPTNICKLQALQRLDLYSCSSLKKFPEILEPMYDLRSVSFSYSGIECLFFVIGLPGFFCPEYFDAVVNIYPDHRNVGAPLLLSDCVSYLIDLPSHPCLRFFSPYYILDLSRELPKNLGSLYYLRELDLTKNNSEEIPASIKQLSLLESLILDGCPNLRSLPQLPTSLCRLSAIYCKSLSTLLAFKQPIFNGGQIMFNFSNCLELEEKESEAMAYKMLRNGPKDVCLCYSGSKITEWFRHQTTGDKIRINLPSNWSANRRFFGFAFCFVFDYDSVISGEPVEFERHFDSVISGEPVEFECHFEDNYNPTIRFTYQTNFNPSRRKYHFATRQHVLVRCWPDLNAWISKRRQLFGLHCINMASFEFYANPGKIEKCGITPLYIQEDDDDEDEYDEDENAYWTPQSSFLTEMSTNEDDEEDMNSGDAGEDADEVCSLTEKRKEKRKATLYIQEDDDDEDEYDEDENAYWTPQSSFLTEMSTNEDDEEDMNSGDAGEDADEVCSLTEKRKEKRKATVEAGSKIKRKREASA